MRKEELAEVAAELTQLAIRMGWSRDETRMASTGSIYIALSRREGNKTEYVVVRVATHKKVYNRWLRCISWSPYELDEMMVMDELSSPFGAVGDVFEV